LELLGGKRMNNALALSALAYFLVGLLLGTLGPGGQDITEHLKRARGTPLLNAATGRQPPTELRLFWARVAITIAFALLWPIFTYSILEDRRQAAAACKAVAERAKGLWYSQMGGCGTITCKDCKHSEDITSFIHGIDSSVSGFQCQQCGKFHGVNAGGRGRANQYERALVCDCGGPLQRDKVLFCPSCKSQNLSYDLREIT
jgi:hypothetical protein